MRRGGFGYDVLALFGISNRTVPARAGGPQRTGELTGKWLGSAGGPVTIVPGGGKCELRLRSDKGLSATLPMRVAIAGYAAVDCPDAQDRLRADDFRSFGVTSALAILLSRSPHVNTCRLKRDRPAPYARDMQPRASPRAAWPEAALLGQLPPEDQARIIRILRRLCGWQRAGRRCACRRARSAWRHAAHLKLYLVDSAALVGNANFTEQGS